MLTSLLPGLRELRAPLATGILWLLALWFIAEPAVPGAAQATGILASAYRLAEPVSALGLGAALGFAAYLVGSLSVFLFSGALRRLIPARGQHGGWGLAGLSTGGERALEQVARDSRTRVEKTLSLSGFSVDDVLRMVDAPPTPLPPPTPNPKVHPDSGDALTLNASTAARTPEEGQEARLAALVVRDLGVIADSQLLGKENDVFSAVDRDRAELEFRLAVIPSLVGLTLALAIRQTSPIAAAVVVLAGAVAAAGLMLDAARQQRAANDLLLNLLEYDRVHAPSLVRLETRAKETADQSPAAIPRLAGDTSTSVRVLIDQLENLAESGAATVPQALDAALAARRSFDELRRLLKEFDPEQPPLDRSVLDDLETAVSGWIARDPNTWSTWPRLAELFPEGLPAERPTSQETADRVTRASKNFPALKDEMRRRAQVITARQAASGAPPA